MNLGTLSISGRRKHSGIVLVMMLVALALMTVLLLALLNGSSHQLRGAESEATLAREKMLADSAVALVMGQIEQASTQPGQAWISQPGLLRTYDALHNRVPTACYKLYSTPQIGQMTDSSGTLNFFAADLPADWDSAANRSFYTDLNAPQQTSGRLIYPILDPEAQYVEEVESARGIQGVKIDDGHDARMLVAWLYQLQDGTLGPASGGTKENPIVARIAFWTDDDTCKININTAGSGSPWNVPHANSADDVAWSVNQPAAGEFSSYPGHPAMTSLLPVFGAGENPLSPRQLLAMAPRYAFGGSQGGTLPTAPGDAMAPKTDRLYTSLDELCFSASWNESGQRQPNPIDAEQIEMARFVLTAHSQAPETTLLGEPRVAIWPVSDTPLDPKRATSADRAIAAAATVGGRNYFFQRGNPLDPLDDFDPASTSLPSVSNLRLFNELVARGDRDIPGYGNDHHFSAKYPGAKWTQLLLEITDFIHGLNAVDPNPAPFVSYAAGDAAGVGRAFVVPLTTTYGSGPGAPTLRGLGRTPTLSGLTLVFYVSGFEFKTGTTPAYIDYDETPDTRAGDDWKARFDMKSPGNLWPNVVAERIRAFVVPTTFQPGCAYPEVSDACDIAITGLDGIRINGKDNPFNFGADVHSRLLSDAQHDLPVELQPADRAWGGNEGSLAWRAAALDALASNAGTPYAFAGRQSLRVALKPTYNAAAKTLTWPGLPSLVFSMKGSLTLRIRDRNGKTLQSFTLDPPAFTAWVPTINGECDHMDDPQPDQSSADWFTQDANKVAPSYYMCLGNRLRATQRNRAFLIQAGDISRGLDASTDLRLVAGVTQAPTDFFRARTAFTHSDSHVHNLRFADGTSAYGASGLASLLDTTYSIVSQNMTGTDWSNGNVVTPSCLRYTSTACSCPPDSTAVTMGPGGLAGDWDTGPGFEPDGALINLPDAWTALAPATAYFSLTGGQPGAVTRRTPNALISSPVIFGSLPAGIDPVHPEQSQPWRTLLFCPNPAAGTAHPGLLTPPDHLLLDHFWMPVVEPYPLSTCMATAGKINLNNQIAPFTYLHRSTAFHALLHDLRLPAISAQGAAAFYKSPGTPLASIWNKIDEDATIANLESRFASGGADAYLSESEICTVPLVPAEVSTPLKDYWGGNFGAGRLTGDNLRELPYAQLYGRLATRSNSYTVHVRVQVLKKLSTDPNQGVWNEDTDLVLGDWRGSYEIERYIDPATAAVTSPVPGQPGKLGPYHIRIVSSHRFSP